MQRLEIFNFILPHSTRWPLLMVICYASKISVSIFLSFADYVGEAWFYLFSYDINNPLYNGPFASETDSVMTQLKNTPTLFPICSLQWKYVTYDVTGDDVSDVGSWDIIPASFKDLRVFNNTSLENFRPNQAFALTQFAPVANDIAYLHNARLISASTAPVFAVSSRTL